MGQFYVLVNVTKKLVVYPAGLRCGRKFHEFSPGRLTSALALLLAKGYGEGSGETPPSAFERIPEFARPGAWAGDQVEIAGEYALPDEDGLNAYTRSRKPPYQDASGHVLRMLTAADK